MRKTLIPHQLSKPLRLGPYFIYLFFNWSRRAEGPLCACLLAQAAAPLNPRFPCTPTLVGERSWDPSLCWSGRKQTRDLPSSRGRGPSPPAPNSRVPTGQTGPFHAWGRVRQCPALSKQYSGWVDSWVGGDSLATSACAPPCQLAGKPTPLPGERGGVGGAAI